MNSWRLIPTIFLFYAFFNIGLETFAVSSDRISGYILADDKGKIICQQNKDTAFVPASILKILTSLAALNTFSDDYRFQTHHYYDSASKDLYIKGYGDPLFISEVIRNFVRIIASQINISGVRHVICDNSYFSRQIRIPGRGSTLNPYDSPVGALCANFNTINFMWNDSINEFVSAEPQTPLLGVYRNKIRQTQLKNGRIVLSQMESIDYTGLLIRHFLNENGIAVSGNIGAGIMPKKADDIHTFKSPYTIEEVVQKLLKFSNNFIANQLLLSLGAFRYGPPATLEKGILAVQNFSSKTLQLGSIKITEGSGLSRENKVTPHQMVTLLESFRPYYQLLNKDQNDYYKTGTLTGIRTRAGFILGQNKKLYPYVIMVNHSNKGYASTYNRFFDLVKNESSH